MAHTLKYEGIQLELESGALDEIQCAIHRLLLKTPQGLTRAELIQEVFGEEPGRNLGNNTHDRKIRKGIERLRDLGVPIVSTSGRAGYKIQTDPAEIAAMIDEMESRIRHLRQKVQSIERFLHRGWIAPGAGK
ncbi:MAG TPA: HTH domain-containing protein [Candidatus Hydrogenedentes bacterium]|nr:HTH domain-containing protein [Candidatus Hydrogenedentota bacterium]